MSLSSQSWDTRDSNTECFSVYAAIAKSPSKVLNAHELDSWENDFTRLPDENTCTYCSPVEVLFRDNDREANHDSWTSISDSSSTDYTLDREGTTFCFHCFNHVCQCPTDSSSGSVATPEENDSKQPIFTNLTSDCDESTSMQEDLSSGYLYESDRDDGSEETSSSFSQQEYRPSRETGTTAEKKMPNIIGKAPKGTECATKHSKLRSSAFNIIVPTCETVTSLLPKLMTDHIVQHVYQKNSKAVSNIARGVNDFYSPRWLRGIGAKKEGLCPLCQGLWLKTKTSRFWYHMNFYHGISAVNGRPYSAPVAIRAVLKSERVHDIKTHSMHQGYCGQCGHWVDLQAKQPLLVPELKVGFHAYQEWWKHAQKCHVLGERYQLPKDTKLDIPCIMVSLPIEIELPCKSTTVHNE
ncbi:hypothetical protein NQZ79_g3380 [Umbelopsis isabellina]|nr:hypothetical protein NQZ79_g3380 [Umbelopsis isabellina]